MSIHDYLASDGAGMGALSQYLDGLDEAGRIHAARSLSGLDQARLFEAAAGVRPITLDDFVPPTTPALVEVIHFGRNSLRMFHMFEKRFCRLPDGGAELWGYNEHSLRWLTGPGYFVARSHGAGEVLIDYLEVPPAKPPGWPPIKPNSAGASRFVYHQTQDVMRGLSRHLSIGRASKRGKPMDNWFVLCRSERTG